MLRYLRMAAVACSRPKPMSISWPTASDSVITRGPAGWPYTCLSCSCVGGSAASGSSACIRAHSSADSTLLRVSASALRTTGSAKPMAVSCSMAAGDGSGARTSGGGGGGPGAACGGPNSLLCWCSPAAAAAAAPPALPCCSWSMGTPKALASCCMAAVMGSSAPGPGPAAACASPPAPSPAPCCAIMCPSSACSSCIRGRSMAISSGGRPCCPKGDARCLGRSSTSWSATPRLRASAMMAARMAVASGAGVEGRTGWGGGAAAPMATMVSPVDRAWPMAPLSSTLLRCTMRWCAGWGRLRCACSLCSIAFSWLKSMVGSRF
mmetsp:Transcript_6090/g.15118  ORF Transcript_6090/g.15118 Transcript_6090/m.15118 type:complete len:322 (+) Transcript_6090:182-1147(+)